MTVSQLEDPNVLSRQDSVTRVLSVIVCNSRDRVQLLIFMLMKLVLVAS